MKKLINTLKASLLSQYMWSSEFFESRFLTAIQSSEKDLKRSLNNQGIKYIDDSEWQNDALIYFKKNKLSMEEEFYSELSKKIGQEKVDILCIAISKQWYKGKKTSKSPELLAVKKAINAYLSQINSGINLSDLIRKSEVEPVDSIFTAMDIAKILTLNDQLTYRHIEAWKETHPNFSDLSNDWIFLRRGLSLNKLINTTLPYKENDYINSYSLAFSITEKFSQVRKNNISAIINGNIDLFKGRILFFSPFIPEMDIGQLEFGIIPSENFLSIKQQGLYGNIYEYIIDNK